METNYSPFLDSILKQFLSQARKENLKTEVKNLTVSDRILLTTVLKCKYLSRPKESEEEQTAVNYFKTLSALKNETLELKDFDKLCIKTLFKYRKHEDDIRHFDFLIRESQNTLEEPKTDRRAAPALFSGESVRDVWGKMKEQEEHGTFHINIYDLINPSLDYDTLKKKVRDLAKKINEVSAFYEAHYNMLPTATNEEYETKIELMALSEVIMEAINTNIKSHVEIDIFIFIIHKQLLQRNNSQLAKEKLQKINNTLNLNKNLSDENLRTIARNARNALDANPKLKEFCSRLVDLS